MLTNDATILKIKHEVLYQVAKLAYAGEFDEKKDELAYKLIPGPKPQFRCCVYKEREIVRQRVRLAEGLCPTESDHSGSKNVIQVIESACADCPLSHYIVTDNCRKCMAKACTPLPCRCVPCWAASLPWPSWLPARSTAATPT